jgi:hypothetical protein
MNKSMDGFAEGMLLDDNLLLGGILSNTRNAAKQSRRLLEYQIAKDAGSEDVMNALFERWRAEDKKEKQRSKHLIIYVVIMTLIFAIVFGCIIAKQNAESKRRKIELEHLMQ